MTMLFPKTWSISALIVVLHWTIPCSFGFSIPFDRSRTVLSTTTVSRVGVSSDSDMDTPTPLSTSTSTSTSTPTPDNDEDTNGGGPPMKVTSTLKFIGPYPSLPLHFPNLATSAQRKNNAKGISLDFVLDTAANTNTINGQVALELNLNATGENALPGFNAAGAMDGGVTYALGDTLLDDVPETTQCQQQSNHVGLFMQGLTASALPVASPAAAGLLGVAFLNCFPGGVRFDWADRERAEVTFYGDDNDDDDNDKALLPTMTRVPIDVIEDVRLPSVPLIVNGKQVRALLDTGSPITVVNAAAAELAGLEVVSLNPSSSTEKRTNRILNPFQTMVRNVQNANALAQAAARGDVLMIAGAEGQAVQLLRTTGAVSLGLLGAAGSGGGEEEETLSFPDSKIYVGDLPGLAALGGLGSASPPAAVLGMDLLTQKATMVYRVNEVYFQ